VCRLCKLRDRVYRIVDRRCVYKGYMIYINIYMKKNIYIYINIFKT